LGVSRVGEAVELGKTEIDDTGVATAVPKFLTG
jgi:hypothetical protein